MAPRKTSRRKGNHMFERTLEDLKSSVDTLGKLVSSYLPGGSSPKKKASSSRKAAASTSASTKKRTAKASPRRKPATAKAARSTRGTATQ
jgi:hypothetical protein